MIALILESALRSLALALVVWLALHLLRVNDAQKKMTAWTFVLIAALAMPFIMQARIDLPLLPAKPQTITIPAMAFEPAITAAPVLTPSRPAAAVIAAPATTAIVAPSAPVDWSKILFFVYAAVTLAFLARLSIGLMKGVRLMRDALPVPGHDGVRASDAITTPLTFASVVLLPADYTAWTAEKLRAVIAHESAHVRHGDFYVQAAAALHKALFWFSPLSWWMQKHIAELAETISDDAAIADLNDRPAYAEILLDVSRNAQEHSMALGMARTHNIKGRIERVISETTLCPRLSARRKLLLAACLIPLMAATGVTGLKAADASVAPAQIKTSESIMLEARAKGVTVSRNEVEAPLQQFVGNGSDPNTLRHQIITSLAEQKLAQLEAGPVPATPVAPPVSPTPTARSVPATPAARSTPATPAERPMLDVTINVIPDAQGATPTNMTLQADQLLKLLNGTEWSGRAEMRHGPNRILADRIRLVKAGGNPSLIEADGNVVVVMDDHIIRADKASYNLQTGMFRIGPMSPLKPQTVEVVKDVPLHLPPPKPNTHGFTVKADVLTPQDDVITAKGHAVLERVDVRIEADNMVFQKIGDSNRVDTATATGNVVVTRGSDVRRGNSAVIDMIGGAVAFIGGEANSPSR